MKWLILIILDICCYVVSNRIKKGYNRLILANLIMLGIIAILKKIPAFWVIAFFSIPIVKLLIWLYNQFKWM